MNETTLPAPLAERPLIGSIADAPAFRTWDTTARAAYDRDGVVCLRQAFARSWLEQMAAGIEQDRRQPGRFFRDQTPEGSPARYVFSYWNWPGNPALRDVVLHSPAAEIAGRLMNAERITMIMDNWFLREAGATNGAPWHHDEPYFDFDGGRMCVVWMPLEPASSDEGLTFAAGSHLWGRLFMPLQFRQRAPFGGVEEHGAYAPVPDIDAEPEKYRLVSWALEPGDCLVFDLRTLHCATAGTKPLQREIRRLSLRFGDQDVRFKPRGVWTEEITQFLIEQGQVVDGKLDCPVLPQVWSAEN
jgi:ectoine hydroxylase-related dioxygenase (phytanoyl-CoA dioxygenase family)